VVPQPVESPKPATITPGVASVGSKDG
jgi:hypothetical protein